MRSSTLHLPNLPGSVSLAADFVQARARQVSLPDREALQLALATAEAASNVVQHAFAPGEEAEFEVECQPLPLGLRVLVRDRGLPFDPEAQSGKGLRLMQRSVHTCTFQNLGLEGKAVELIQLRPAQPLIHLSTPSELNPYVSGVPAGAGLEEDEQVEIRPMRADEAVEVSRCVYRAYGYSYVYEHAYYPERLVELNRSGQLLSAVAVSSKRGVLGHAALMHAPGEPIGEVGMAVVRPDTRGLGLCRRLFAFLLDETAKHELLVAYSQAVTAHPASQKVLHSLGFQDSGLLLAYAPASLSFRGLAEELGQRESVVLCQRILVDRGPLKLYSAPQHQEFLGHAFATLGMQVEWVEPPPTPPPAEHSLGFRLDRVVRHRQAHFDIIRANAQTVDLIRSRLRELCRGGIEAIQLWLSLHDPVAVSLVSQFESMGFFLGGVQPGWRGQDALILQYLNNIHVDLDKLALEGDTARRIARAIGRLVPTD